MEPIRQNPNAPHATPLPVGAGWTILPPPIGTCSVCGVAHDATEAHECTSLFYQARFHVKYRRYPTWSDCVAHLDAVHKSRWRLVLLSVGAEFTEHPEPISEPYAEVKSD